MVVSRDGGGMGNWDNTHERGKITVKEKCKLKRSIAQHSD